MKAEIKMKLCKYLNFAFVIALIVLGYEFGNQKTFPVIMTVAILGMLAMSYFYFEANSMGTKEIAVIATLSAFAAVTRVPFAAIPGVQPTTFLVALSGLVFGCYEGFLVGSTAAFVSNIFLGQGPWTPWQMFSWGLVGAISGLIGRNGRKPGVEKFAFICLLYGFMFDWIMNLWHVLGFIRPLTLKSIFLGYLAGLTMDVMHAVGNFIFAIIFYESFYKVLVRFKNRLSITYIKE